MLSLLSFNVDGLARVLPDGLAAQHAAWGKPDLLCLQEVRVRASDAASIAAMASALPGYQCFFSLNDDPVNVRFRGGRAYGVATYVRRELNVHEVPRASWDREGRLEVLELPDFNLAVANLYAVNGSDKPYFDHERGALHGDRHQFKRAFQSSCLQAFSLLRERGRALVLIGDWNVSRSKLDTYPRLRTEPPHALARAQLNEELMPALDVVDVYRERHPAQRAYTWFSRSAARYGRLDAARVDYALISRSLVPHVVSVGIASEPGLRFGSDHAPISLSLAL
jgi:exodeoxyribonuclease III